SSAVLGSKDSIEQPPIGKSPGSKATKYNFRKRTMKKTLSEISPKTSNKKHKLKKKMQKQVVQEAFRENIKVCGYSRNEDVNQNVLNKECIDVITIDVEVERVKNDVSKKKKDSLETKQDWLSIRTRGSPKVLYNLMKNLSPAQMKDIIDIGFGSMIGMASKEIPGKIAHFVVNNFDDDSMKLKLSNGVISITPELVYKVLGVPLGETKIKSLDWCKYVCMCLKMSKINWIRNGENSFYSGPLTALTCDLISVPRERPAIKYWTTELIKKREVFEISNGGFGLLHLYSDDSSDDDIFERELDSKMDKLDQKVTLLKLIVEDLEFEFLNCLMDHPNSSRLKDIKAKYNGIIRNTYLSDFGYAIEDKSIHHESEYENVFIEMDNSLNFNDTSGNYNVGECNHGVEELDNDFINETNEENGEDSSEEEMIEENEAQMFVKGTHEEKKEEILNQHSIEVNVLKVNEAGDDKEKSAVGGFEDCLMKGLFRQDAQPDNSVRSFGNPFRVSTSDMPKHRLDEPLCFSFGPEFDEFSIKEINQTNVKDESRVAFSETESHCSQKEKQSFDRIQTVFFRAESEIDVLKEYIKPDIKDENIRVQPKRDSSIVWYLKSPFKVRGSALNNYANILSQTEVLTADTLFIMDEETDPIEIIYSSCTNNVKIPRLFLESLAPGLKIDEPVIDAWADLLNFNKRYKSANSPSRYFFKPILTGKVVIIDNSFVDDNLTTRQRYFKVPQELKKVDKDRSIDKNTRRELIENAVLRRTAKLDEYLGIIKS
nr:hypothetical protein [Tanacetum cinerariifolium]